MDHGSSPLSHPPGVALVLGVLMVWLLAGCGVLPGGSPGSAGHVGQEGEVGEAATWEIKESHLVDPNTTFLVVDVTRVGCSSGVTGEVLEPAVRYAADRVEIRIDVAPLPSGEFTCQGNDTTGAEVILAEPLGVRPLVDAGCADSEAAGTAACAEAVRWAPPPGLELARGVPDWQAPQSYSFTVQSSCGEQAFIGEYAVTVTDGRVSAVEALRVGWDDIRMAVVPTITEMLEQVDKGDSAIWVDRDGVPRWLHLDPMPEAIDDESCFLITDYQVG